MKVVLAITVFLVLFALIFPVAASWSRPEAAVPSGDADPQPSSEPPSTQPPPTAPEEPGDPQPGDAGTVAFLEGGAVRSVTVRDYLLGALAAEMPASFEPEALKAQAVALRSYLAYKRLHRPSGHPEADICASGSCCAAWKSEDALRDKWGADFDANMAKIAAAVDATAGLILTYEGAPVLAAFHSSSAGRTESSDAIWGEALPYLVSVPSPEGEGDVPNFVVSVTVSAQDFKETVLDRYPGADLSGGLSSWIGASVLDESGRVSSVSVGGISLTGAQLRSLFGLRSAAIELTVEDGAVTLTTRGYGHGVGMSQYGANVLAGQGMGFADILSSYYPGTALVRP